MFQNVFMTTLTPLRDNNNTPVWNNEVYDLQKQIPGHKWTQDSCINIIKQKKKRIRTAFTTDQIRALEKTYARSKYIDREERHKLAHSLSIGERCLKVWFQNRRMKEKKEIAESNTQLVQYCFDPISPTSTVSSPSPSPEIKSSNQEIKQGLAIQNTMYDDAYYDNNWNNTQVQFYPNIFPEFQNTVPAQTDYYYNNTQSNGTHYNPGIYQNDYDVQMSYLQENQNCAVDWSAHTFDITHL